MKILTIFSRYFPSEGGIQRVIKNLNEKLAERGHNVTVLCLHEGKTEIESINGVNVIRIPDKRFFPFFDYSFALNNFLIKNTELLYESDIIHIHGYHALIPWQCILLLNKLGFSKKIVYTPHYGGQGSTFPSDILLKVFKCISKSNFTIPQKIVCISEYEKMGIIKNFPNATKKITLISNGINFQIPTKLIERKIDSNNIKILFVGRVVWQKGPQYIIKMMSIFRQKYHGNISLTIIGSGKYEEYLKKYIKINKIQNVSFEGQISSNQELADYYKKSDLLILLSQSESYGLVVAEALVNGVITIVSNNTALKEFGFEKGCFLFDYPPNIENLADFIHSLCQNLQQIGPFNPQKIRDWETAATEYEAVYNSIYYEYYHSLEKKI